MPNHEPVLTRSLLFTIGAGSVLSALLMAGVSLFGLLGLAATDARPSRVASENTVKERLANDLRDLLRARASTQLSIVVIADAIDKYDELERFYRLGEEYRLVRQALERQLSTAEEKPVLARIDRLRREYRSSEPQMAAIQQSTIATASSQAKEADNRTLWLMLVLGAAAVALVVGILLRQRTARLSRETEEELTVRSRAGQGSVFELALPLVVAHRPAQASALEALAPQPAFFSARILVVEGNPINQKLIQCMLEKHGLSVSIVADSRQAYDAIRAGGIDLVLMDCQMPAWDCLTTTRAVRLWEQAGSAMRIPIVALTANAMAGFDRACLEVGMDDCLIKPLDPQLLFACLRKWLPATAIATSIPPAPSATELPMRRFDLCKVEDTCNGDPAKIREMLELFKTSTAEQLERLADAVMLGEHSTVARMAHQIKGGCAYLGSDAMCSLASTIEKAAKSGEASQLVLLSEDMEAEFIALKNEIDQVLAGQAG